MKPKKTKKTKKTKGKRKQKKKPPIVGYYCDSKGIRTLYEDHWSSKDE